MASTCITSSTAEFDNEKLRQARITMLGVTMDSPPIGVPFPATRAAFEKYNFAVADLDPLGRKLLGLDPWD